MNFGTWLIELLARLIPEFILRLFKKETDSMEPGDSTGKTEEELKDKIDEKW